MLLTLIRRLAAPALLLVMPFAVRAADPPPLEAYGRMPDIESVALSNSGNRVAAVMTIKGQRVVILLTIDLKPIRVVPLNDSKLRSIEWVGDDYVLVMVSRTETLGPEYINAQHEFFHVFIVSANDTEAPQLIFDKDQAILNAVFGTFGSRQIGGRWLGYFAGIEKTKGVGGYYLGGGGPTLFAVDIAKNARTRVATSGSGEIGTDWILDADGRVAATFSIQAQRGDWQINVPNGRVLASGTAPRGDAGLVAIGKDGRSLIYRERNDGAGRTLWYEVPLDGLAPAKVFAAEEDIDRLYTDRNTGRLIGLLRVGSDARPEFFDPKYQEVVDQIYRAFPQFHVQLEDWNPDFSKVLVRTTANGDSGTWYLVDVAQMKAKALGYERDQIGPDATGAVSTVRYKAQDGTDLDGILTLPPGREPRNLAVVVFPHGGPHAYDTETFDWWAQAFASRGYAVFQPNFRGSTNRDEAFMRAGFGQWGLKMQTDISDGFAELVKRGIVDPKRACIMGASYGGYAALAGVTLQHGLYRCSVDVAGISDIGELFSSEYNGRGREGMLRRSLDEELGPRSGWSAVSPRNFAARADAPILLIHGRDDTVVPFRQTDQMADALKDAGKTYKFVVLKHEDHWLSSADTRLQMLQEALEWVQKYDPPN
jgi:dienelactone hydrolase